LLCFAEPDPAGFFFAVVRVLALGFFAVFFFAARFTTGAASVGLARCASSSLMSFLGACAR
jgi:hypothetical protein